MTQHSAIDLGTGARLVAAATAGYLGLSPTVFLLLYTGTEAWFIAGHNGTDLLNAPMPRQRFASVAADTIAAGIGYGIGSWLRSRKSSSSIS